MKRVNLRVSDDEWKAFKLACVRVGLPMTKVLWKGAQMYLAGKPMQETKGLGYHTSTLRDKEGRKE